MAGIQVGKGSLIINDALVVFGENWFANVGPTPDRQNSAATERGGRIHLVNTNSGYAAFTVERMGVDGLVDVYTVSPDARDLRYVVTVDKDGAKSEG